MNSIVNELKEIQAKVTALINLLESENKSSIATVSEVRKVAVLEEVFRLGGIATPQEISEIAKKYGKTPSSTAGYYSGKKPSMEATEDRSARRITDTGIKVVEETRQLWGEDWLDRLPMDIIGNEHTPDTEISF
ncbi:hypothetical protein [Faecalimonas sp.]